MTRLSRLSSGGCPPALWGLRIPSPRVAVTFWTFAYPQVTSRGAIPAVKPSTPPAPALDPPAPAVDRLSPIVTSSTSSQEGVLDGVTSRQVVTSWCAPRWAVLVIVGVSAQWDSAAALVERMLST